MWLLTWMACVTEENFPTQAATVVCRRYEECDKGNFESTYEDQADCVDSTEPSLDDFYSCLATECTFNAGNANDCISGYKTQSCEDLTNGEIPSACEEVYEGCDDVDVAACLLDAAL